MTMVSAFLLAAVFQVQDVPACDPAFLERPGYARMSTAPVLPDAAILASVAAEEYGGVIPDDAPVPAIWVATDGQGRVAAVQLGRSSGDARMDSVALRTLRRLDFGPATYNGEPVCAWVYAPFRLPTAAQARSEPGAASTNARETISNVGAFKHGEVAEVDPVPLSGRSTPRPCHAVAVCTSTCPFCAELAEQNPPHLVWLVLAPHRNGAEAFAERHGIPIDRVEWLAAPDEQASLRSLGLSGTPTFVVLDEAGVVLDVQMTTSGSADYVASVCDAAAP